MKIRKRFLLCFVIFIIVLSGCNTAHTVNQPIESTENLKPFLPSPEVTPNMQTGFELVGSVGKDVVRGAAWSPEGDQIALLSTTGVYFYETATWVEKMAISNPDFGELYNARIIYHPNNEAILIFDQDKFSTYQYLDLKTQEMISWFPEQELNPLSLPVFSPDGNLFVLRNDRCQLNDKNNMECIFQLELRQVSDGTLLDVLFVEDLTKEEQVIDFEFSPDSKIFAAACADHQIRVWDLVENKQIYTFYHDSRVTSIDFSPDGKRLISAGKDAVVKYWDLETGTVISYDQYWNEDLQAVSFIDHGKGILVGEIDTNLYQVYLISEEDPSQLRPIQKMDFGYSPVGGYYNPDKYMSNESWLSPDDQYLAVNLNSQLRIWDLNDPEKLISFPGFFELGSLAINEQENLIAAAGYSIELLDTNLKTQKLIQTGASLPIETISFNKRGDALAAYVYTGNPGIGRTENNGEGFIAIWDVFSGEKVNEIIPECDLRSLAYSPNREQIAGGGDCGIFIWDLVSGEEIRINQSISESGSRLIYNEEGNKLFWISKESRAAWDLENAELIYSEPVNSYYFSLVPSRGVIWDAKMSSYIIYDPLSGIEQKRFAGGITPDSQNTFWISEEGDFFFIAHDGVFHSINILSGEIKQLDLELDDFNRLSSLNSEHWLVFPALTSFTLYRVVSTNNLINEEENFIPTTTVKITDEITPNMTETPVVSVEEESFGLNPSFQFKNVLGLGEINIAAWAADDTTFALGGKGGIYLYRLGENQFFQEFFSELKIDALVFNQTGKYLAVYFENSEIQILDVDDGGIFAKFDGPFCRYPKLVFYDDSQGITLTCDDSNHHWRWENEEIVYSEESVQGNLSLEDGYYFKLNGSDLELYTRHTQERIKTFNMPGMVPFWVEFSPEGTYLAIWFASFFVDNFNYTHPAEGEENLVQIWRLIEDNQLQLFHTIALENYSPSQIIKTEGRILSFSADEKKLFITGGENFITVFDIENGVRKSNIPDDGIIFLSQGGKMISLSEDIKIRDLSADNSYKIVQEINQTISAKSLMRFSENALIVNDDHQIKIMDLDGKIIDQVDIGETAEDFRYLAAGGNWTAFNQQNSLELLNLTTQPLSLNRLLETNQDTWYLSPIFGLEISSHGKWLITSDKPAENVLLWDLRNLQSSPKILEEEMGFHEFYFTKDEKQVVGYRQNNSEITIMIWNLETGKKILRWETGGSKLSVNPENHLAANYDYSNSRINIMNIDSGSLINTINLDYSINTFKFNPDGDLLWVVMDNQIRLYDPISGEVDQVIDGEYSQIVFSGDGTLAALQRDNGKIEIWELIQE